MLARFKRTTTSLKALVSFAEAIFICVPTEDDGTGKCDLSILEAVVGEVAVFEDSNFCVCRTLVQRSTVPPGTASRMSKKLKRIQYVVNPSFLVMATKEADSVNPDKVILGVTGGPESETGKQMAKVYSWIDPAKVFFADPLKVEVAKYLENALQSTLVSFWNNGFLVAQKAGVSNFVDIVQLVCQTPDLSVCGRIPGKAFGGACLPKDLRALIQWCLDNEVPAPLFEGVQSMNAYMKEAVGVGDKSAVELYKVKAGEFQPLATKV
jgi:UDPglucose 6-dehydrogenase